MFLYTVYLETFYSIWYLIYTHRPIFCGSDEITFYSLSAVPAVFCIVFIVFFSVVFYYFFVLCSSH